MCRRTIWSLSWALLLAVSTGRVPAVAQTTEAELLRRIETLRPVLDEARRALEDATTRRELERAARARGTMQIVHAGPFRIATVPDQAALAAELFEEVWRTDFASIDESPALSREVFTFQWWGTSRAEIYVDLDAPDTQGTGVRRVEVSRIWVRTRAGLTGLVRDAIWAALRDDFPGRSPLRSWLRETRYVDPEEAYRALAVTPSEANRACLAGLPDGCIAAFGLDLSGSEDRLVTRDRLVTLFTPEERIRMVALAVRPRWGSADVEEPVARACLEEDDVSACDRLLLENLRWTEGAPAPPEARVSLLWYAVGRGGEGAWRRAIQNPDASPSEILANASALPIEQLAADWRAHVSAARPVAHAGLGRTSLTVLLWLLLLGAFAMRSTRWRLG